MNEETCLLIRCHVCTPPNDCSTCSDLLCVTAAFADVTRVANGSGTLGSTVVYHRATGSANGDFELPRCGSACQYGTSVCGTITLTRETESVGDPGPFLTFDRPAFHNIRTTVGATQVQTYEVVPGTVHIGDTFTLRLDAPLGMGPGPATEDISFVATVATAVNVTAGLTAAINAAVGSSYYTTVEVVDNWPGASQRMLIRPRTRSVGSVQAVAGSMTIVSLDLPMTLVEVTASATYTKMECCGGTCCQVEGLDGGGLPIFRANVIFQQCPTGEITMTNGVVALGVIKYPDDTFNDTFNDAVTDGQSIFWNAGDAPGVNYTGGTTPNEFGYLVGQPTPPFIRWANGGTVVLTLHHTGEGTCPAEFTCPCPGACIDVIVSDVDVTVLDDDPTCRKISPSNDDPYWGYTTFRDNGKLNGRLTLSQITDCVYALCIPAAFTEIFHYAIAEPSWTPPDPCPVFTTEHDIDALVNAVHNNGNWKIVVLGTGSGGIANLTECVTDPVPLIYGGGRDDGLGGTVAIDLTPRDDCPPPDGDCGFFHSAYRHYVRCPPDATVSTYWMTGANSAGYPVFKLDGVCYYRAEGAETLPGGATVIDPADVVGFASCHDCDNPDECSETCITCDACAAYCPDPDKTFLRVQYLIHRAECGICTSDPIGGGCGHCCNCSSVCRGCGFDPNPGGPAIDCGCFVAADLETCLGLGHQWWCDPVCIAHGDDPGAVVSPCSSFAVSGTLDLPLTAHTSTTRTFSETFAIGGRTISFTAVQNCATGVTTWTISFNSGRCVMTGTSTGDCTDLIGGLTTYFRMEDTTLSVMCGGLDGNSDHNGIEINSAVVNETGCP